MASTLTWSIAQLEREVSDGFVFTAHWRLDAKDGAFSAGTYGAVSFSRPDSLIPFDQLTEELVISWVKEELGASEVAKLEKFLNEKIQNQKYPKTEQGLPWPTPEEIETEALAQAAAGLDVDD